MKYEFRRNLHQNYLIVETSWNEAAASYQTHMLEQNQISGLLRCQRKYLDDRMEYQYEITGMYSLLEYAGQNPITVSWLHSLLGHLLRTAEQMEAYLLDISHLVLMPELIYYEETRGFSFCYFPEEVREHKIVFHELIAWLIQYVDHQDQRCVTALYGLYKETMEANYSLRDILERRVQLPEEALERLVTEHPEAAPAPPVAEAEPEPGEEAQSGLKGLLLAALVSIALGIAVFQVVSRGLPVRNDPGVIGLLLLVAAVVFLFLYQHCRSSQDEAAPAPPQTAEPKRAEAARGRAGGPRLASRNDSSGDLVVQGRCFIIGSSEGIVDGYIPAASVSRTHCKIVRRKNQYRIIDMDSRNGTYAGQERITGSAGHMLRDGDQIRIADLDYLWVYNPASE